ncbi:MAG: T9SS type A sorting domain-containing protein [Saprospiraceae bacterium]|uniref:T9SS type A sorting domain-containing protein n=1 Tax=Candidatus Opimibacter skivensis TaxID=2982028 RepID=A0A9D7SY93_9BACT|nr:T9SS type A sorting domain-containing protein [Candidatus Opimibacter skivensis]
MNKKYSILALFASAFLWFGFPTNPPNGNTGAPGESTCGTSCHTLNGGTQDGNVTVTGLPASIEPCTNYVLTVTSSNPNGVAVVAGFQLTILNSANQIAGTLSSPSSGSQLETESGRQYWEHNTPASYPASHMVSWTATWKSPSSPANTTVTCYVANNIANGNGSDTGDKIVTNTATGTLNGGAPTLTVSIPTSSGILCNGQNTGSATAAAAGGIAPFTYNWSNGGSGATISNLPAGTYTVTVSDNCSSTSTSSITIGQPPILGFSAATITNVSCNGGTNGSITAHGTGGVAPYTYNWSNGGSGATISNLAAGAYTVTVTDNNGCTKTSVNQVTQPAVIVINLVTLTHESCFGQADGAITISVTGGVNPIFVEWSNGFLGTTINNLAPDMYSVTVTDNNACTKTATYTVNPGGVVNVNLNQQVNVTCPGGANGSISVTASGGLAPYTYEWSNGATVPVISNLIAGSYIVTATDSHGCVLVKGYTITQPQPIDIQVQQTIQNLCFGNSNASLTSVATGGTSPYTASWSNGVNGNTNSNLPAGTYTVTITDENGCTNTKSAIVTSPAQVTVNVTTTDETGVGQNNGTATATPAGGTGAFTYLWSNGGTTAMITGLPPATYTVTVSDANSCNASGSAQVDPFGCSLDLQLGVDVIICEGDTALVMPFISGETGNVTFLWSDGSTGDSLLVAHTGEYCLTITDEGGCQDMDCIIVTEIIIPEITGTVVNESSPGAMNGSIQLDVISGIVTYLWSTGATTPNISGLSPGVFCVTVADVNGCSKSQCFNVQPGNCQLGITSVQTNILCAGDTTGSITITANNTTPPVSYTWSNGASTAVINNLAAGSYSVTVSDGTGCFATDTYVIIQPDPLAITIDTVFHISNIGGGAINVTTSGGVMPYQFVWLFPDGSQLPGTEDIDNLSLTGNYVLGVTDGNGCTLSSIPVFVDTDVAVDRPERYKSLKVYPVPTDDVLIVDMESPMTEVLISGVDGRLFKRFDHPLSNHLNVSDLESGWYIIRISDGKSWYFSKIVK